MTRWFVLLGCVIGLAVSVTAILTAPLGLFQKPMIEEFGWSRTEFSAVLSFIGLSYAILTPASGYLVDRFGPQRNIFVGIMLSSVFIAALSLIESYTAFVLIACLAVAAGNLALYPAYLSLLRQWFDKRLGLAIGATSAGAVIGAAASAQIALYVIETRGWRSAFLVIGLICLIVGLFNLLLFIRENKGPLPPAERGTGASETSLSGTSFSEAVRSTDFWLIAAAFTLQIIASYSPNLYLPAFLSDQGDGGKIASVIIAVAIGQLLGRFASGALLDRFPVAILATFFVTGQALGFALLLTGTSWALLSAFLLGGLQGAEIDLMAYAIARRFGRLAYGRIFGTCFGISLCGTILTPIIIGTSFDFSGSYRLLFMILPAISLLSLWPIWAARISTSEYASR